MGMVRASLEHVKPAHGTVVEDLGGLLIPSYSAVVHINLELLAGCRERFVTAYQQVTGFHRQMELDKHEEMFGSDSMGRHGRTRPD